MTAPLQPPARRLLTEANAGAAVGNASTPLGAALDGRFERLSRRGQADGYAALGPDGLVVPAQLPPLSPVLIAVKPADTARASTIAPADDPHLTFATVTPGTYAVEGRFIISGNTGGDFRVGIAGTAAGTGTFTFAGVTTGGAATDATSLYNGTAATRGIESPVPLTGWLQVTAPGSVSLQWAQAATQAVATVLGTGSWLRLSRGAA